MDPGSFLPIVLPPGWDAQKDCEYFEDRWEPEPTYTAGLWRMMRFHGGNFRATLSACLAYFQRKDPTLVQIELTALSSREKIEALQECARTSVCAVHFRERLLEELRACEIAERERERVLREYRQARDGAWMYPVIEVIDYLGDAEDLLRETLQSETDDFQAVVRCWQEERSRDDDF